MMGGPRKGTDVMAGDWIKMCLSLWDDGRVRLIARHASVTLLARPVSRIEVLGALYRLWSLADEHSVDGFLKGWTVRDMDAEVGLDGFCQALQHPDVNWLEQCENGLKCLRYETHNGTTGKKRAQAQRRKKLSRLRHASSVTDVTPRAGPEKRREEEKKTPLTPQGGEALRNPWGKKRRAVM